jgi:hypothetical protein
VADRGGTYDPHVLTPAVLLTVLVIGMLALLPVQRLRAAGWPFRWLLAAWLTYTIAGILIIRVPGPFRFLLPILVLAILAPFVAGPERLTRLLGGRLPRRGAVIIDVTPRLRRDRPVEGPDREADPGRDPRDPPPPA